MRTGGGSTGDGHHGWASAAWLLLIRSLLLAEDGTNRLHIAPHLPADWFESAGSLAVERAPTLCGPVSYSMEWEAGQSRVRVRLQSRLASGAHAVWVPPAHPGSITRNGSPVKPTLRFVEMQSGESVVEYTRSG